MATLNPVATHNLVATPNLVATHSQEDTLIPVVTLNPVAIHNLVVTLSLVATHSRGDTLNPVATNHHQVVILPQEGTLVGHPVLVVDQVDILLEVNLLPK